MHGIIFAELKSFVLSELGNEGWERVVVSAGLNDDAFLASQVYPDEWLVALVGAASKVSRSPVPQLLEAFGEYIVPDLLKVYGAFVKPNWRTMDLLEHTEVAIHKAVRLRDRGADPPRLRTERLSRDAVLVRYDSPRRLCQVGVGIIRGVAHHFQETVEITERSCMHRGDAQCEIVVQKSD